MGFAPRPLVEHKAEDVFHLGPAAPFELEPADRTDMVGFLRRQEMRQHLKAMKDKERNAFISKHRDDMDLEMALAIVEMPSAFSGVLNGDRTDFVLGH